MHNPLNFLPNRCRQARNGPNIPYSWQTSMKFEHLIEINNPGNPAIELLSREQLWRGLVLRAEAPTLFVEHLDSCNILERSDTILSRSLRYGKLTVRDRVRFIDQYQVCYHVHAQGEISAASLTMTIEEPESGYLFVRFTYEDECQDTGPDAEYNDYRRSAYLESDIDTIRTIRQLAAEGRLGKLSDMEH